MKFEEVLPALKAGKKIRRKDWNKKNYITVGEDDLIINENNYAIPFALNDFEKDNWEIVKEPKKVKLRDLTVIQFIEWKDKNCDEDCDNFVFNNVSCRTTYKSCWVSHKDLFSDKFLDQEIEDDPILTEEEREYLSAVIKPFRNRVRCIYKISPLYTEYCRIGIQLYESIDNRKIDEIYLNYFDIKTMYKGMEINKKYTLDELGL